MSTLELGIGLGPRNVGLAVALGEGVFEQGLSGGIGLATGCPTFSGDVGLTGKSDRRDPRMSESVVFEERDPGGSIVSS